MTDPSPVLSWGEWHLAEPFALVAGLLAILPWIASRRRRRIAWPTLEGFRGVPAGKAGILRHVPTLLQSLAFLMLAVALARPRAVGGQERIAARGVAIVAAIDRSASMSTEDFPSTSGKTSRLTAARSTLERFIEGRPDDLIGVIAFANVPRRVSAPTLDHGFVQAAVRSIRPARSGEGGTNLGQALAMGLGELRGLSAPRKVLILLTDGRDSPAASDLIKPIAPEEAASLAGDLGVTLHTIAIGGQGKRAEPEKAGSPVDEPGPDYERLEELARLGGGRAFVASDAETLETVFSAIDALEKSPMVGLVRTRYREGYPAFVVAGLACLVLGRWLGAGWLRVLP